MRIFAKLGIITFFLLVVSVSVWKFLPQFWGAAVYPLKYENFIKKYADQYNFDPNYIAAVIFTESTFNADSTSYAGARGLMQIMPSTASWIATQVGEKNFTQDKLFDPETSIKFGCFYIDSLADQFNGNKDLAMAAYNAGSGSVRSWQRISPSDPLSVSSSVRGYVNKINKTKAMYDKIYGNWYIPDQVITAPAPKPWYTLPSIWIGNVIGTNK